VLIGGNRIGALQDELKRRDERIAELRDEIDENRDLIRRQREYIEERNNYLEEFITTFGLTLDEDNHYTNGDFIKSHNELLDENDKLITDYNKLVRKHNELLYENNDLRGDKRPVGRPIAASETQQAQALAYHKEGKSIRWIAESMTLSRRTVSTIIDKADDVDRTTTKRRVRLGHEPKSKPKRRKWSFSHLPKRATTLIETARELDTEARGLGSSRRISSQ
jgi:transposase